MKPTRLRVDPIDHLCEYFYNLEGQTEFKSEQTGVHNADQILQTSYRYNQAGKLMELSGLASDGKQANRFHQPFDCNSEGAPIRKAQTVGPQLDDLFVEEVLKLNEHNGSFEKVSYATYRGLGNIAREGLGSGIASKINLRKSFLDPLLARHQNSRLNQKIGFTRLSYDQNNRLIQEVKARDESETRSTGFAATERFYDENENLILEQGENKEGVFRKAYHYNGHAATRIETVQFPSDIGATPSITTEFLEFDTRGNQVGTLTVDEQFEFLTEEDKFRQTVQVRNTSIQLDAREKQQHIVAFSVIDFQGKKHR